MNVLKESGYDGGMITEKGGRTSYSVVLAMPGIDRIFLHDPGANNTFCADDVKEEYLQDAALFHFGYPPLMKRMFEDEGAETLRLMKKVKAHGLATSLDMVAVDPSSEAGQQDWRKIIEKVIPYVDFFVPSVEELCFMLDRDRYESWAKRAAGGDITMVLDPQQDIKPLADDLIGMGAKAVLIKSGAPGMYYRTAGREVLSQVGERAELDAAAWAGLEGFERSFIPEKVLSGTGAGDTCIAAFLTSMLQGFGPQRCLQLASAAGTNSVESYDALGGLKSFAEMESRIDAGWENRASGIDSIEKTDFKNHLCPVQDKYRALTNEGEKICLQI